MEEDLNKVIKGTYSQGFAAGFEVAQLHFELIRQSLIGWRPFTYVMLGMLLGYLLGKWL